MSDGSLSPSIAIVPPAEPIREYLEVKQIISCISRSINFSLIG